MKHCYFPMPERRLFERSRMQERQCCKENAVLDPQLFFQIRKTQPFLILFSLHSDCGKYINFRCCSNTNGVSCMAIPKAIFKFTSTAKNGLYSINCTLRLKLFRIAVFLFNSYIHLISASLV